jgi:hypothetical protein
MQTKTVQYDIKYDEVLEYKRRKSARLALHRAICAGHVTKAKCCELCSEKTKLDGHHIDYGKPLDVKWLCKKCHGIAHTDGHEWNPDCNEQTGIEDVTLNDKDYIRVNFTIPVEEYIQLQMECEERKISVACRLRQVLIQSKEDENDEPQHEKHARVSSLEQNETSVPKPKVKPVPEPRSKRNRDMQRVDGGLWPLLQGNGANARELQRA